MARMPVPSPDELGPEARALYDGITGGPRAAGRSFPMTDEEGRLHGPFNAMLSSPAVGERLQALGAVLRYETGFTARAREIAILVVAGHWGSAYEAYAHERVGRAAGLSEGVVADLRAGRAPELPDPYESAVYRTTVALAVRGDLDDAEYAAAEAALGAAGVFELSTLVGYYATLALQLRIFRVGVPEG
ncbi:MAG TPA: carboxymuconolactone decarboxylase family protein [Streptosporangiaceae bacterium]|jgi:4-carboxymuconolactone decarboxylase